MQRPIALQTQTPKQNFSSPPSSRGVNVQAPSACLRGHVVAHILIHRELEGEREREKEKERDREREGEKGKGRERERESERE